MTEAPTIPETPPGGGDPQAGRRALAAEIEDVRRKYGAADGAYQDLIERNLPTILAALRDREPPPDASWRDGAEADFAERIRAELPEDLRACDLEHDVRALRHAQDAEHRNAVRWGDALVLMLPFLDMAAGEGICFAEQEDGSPAMDAADICVAVAERLGCSLGDAAYVAMVERGERLIRSLPPTGPASTGAGEHG